MAHWNHEKAAKLARAVTRMRAGLLPSADGSCVSAAPPGPAAASYGLISRNSRPLQRTSTVGQRAQLSSATWNWLSTETTQGMGRVAAKMYTVTGSSMTAELLHPTTVIHHFPTHAARTGAVERSDERLNKLEMYLRSLQKNSGLRERRIFALARGLAHAEERVQCTLVRVDPALGNVDQKGHSMSI